MSLSEAILNKILEYVPTIWGKAKSKLSLAIFKLFRNKKPYSDKKAKQYAQGVLAGRVEGALSFRNVNSTKSYIAVLHRQSLEEYRLKLIILRQLGHSFEAIYSKELFKFPSNFEITDIDKDGIHEVAYILKDGGSGAGTNNLKIYSIKHKEIFELSEYFEWQNALTAEVSERKITEGIDPDFKKYFEKYAVTKGFLQENPIDLSIPENAVQNWHSMNGEKDEGKIRLYKYQSAPQFGSSIFDTAENERMKWIAHFKGPLIGYKKETDQHFIAYSPANTYNWAKSIALYKGKVLFTTQTNNGIYVFSFEGDEGNLEHIEQLGGDNITDVYNIVIEGKHLKLNDGTLRVPLQEITL